MKKHRKIVSKCCICKKVKHKEGFKFDNKPHMEQWGHHRDIEDIEKDFEVYYSHGVCEDCAETHYGHV